MKTILIEYYTDVSNKSYTKCCRGIIVGSDPCRNCKYFKGMELENLKKPGKGFVIHGIVECSNVDKNLK